MKKKVIFGIIILSVLFLIADYCELLKCVHISGAIVKSVKFQFTDSKENPINNVFVMADLNNNDLGGRFVYDDRDSSIVYGQVGIGASWKKTIFFRKPNPHNRKIKKMELKFVFQHPNYLEQEQIYLVKHLKGKTHTVILQPKEQANEKDN